MNLYGVSHLLGCRRRTARVISKLTFLLATGCVGDVASEAVDTRGDAERLNAQGSEPQVAWDDASRVLYVRLEGEDCGPEPDVNIDDHDQSSFTLAFARLELGDGGSCTVRIGLETPAGLRIGFPRATVRWAAMTPGDAPPARLLISERWANLEAPVRETTLESTSNGDPEAGTLEGASGAGPECGAQVEYVVTIDAAPDATRGGFLQVDSLDASFTFQDGAPLFSCAGAPAQIAASTSGEGCGGVFEIPCDAGLGCQVSGPGEKGSCTQPKQVGLRGDLCATNLEHTCGEGLICQFPTEALSTHPYGQGMCVDPVESLGGSCGGHPVIPCADGLVCVPRSFAGNLGACSTPSPE